MDPYALLGVTRAASTADVERAYRRLARRYHPGVNPGDEVAERMYEQVQGAFFVLGDSERRGQYDSGLVPGEARQPVAFEGFDFSAPADETMAATFSELFADVFAQAAREATTPTRGQDLEVTLHVSFEDAVRGAQVPVSVTRNERCQPCRGRGFVTRAVASCPGCGGHGSVRWARGHMVFSRTCPTCGGDGQSVKDGCRACHGAGLASGSQVVTVAIPPGIESSSRIAVPGRGHAGAMGGPYGDLYLTVDVGEHRYFRRDGADLHLTLPVSVAEAAFGTTVTVPGIDGPIEVTIPAGLQSGARLTIPGAGSAERDSLARGKLIVTVQVALPRSLDAESRRLLREFGRINRDDDVRQDVFQ